MLPKPALEPGNEPVDEVDHARALLVDEDVFLRARQVEVHDPSVHRSVEELDRRLDESSNAPAVEPHEAQELGVVDHIERRHDAGEHLGVVRPNSIVGRRRNTELAAESTQQLR